LRAARLFVTNVRLESLLLEQGGGQFDGGEIAAEDLAKTGVAKHRIMMPEKAFGS